jgi:hypothetical protein
MEALQAGILSLLITLSGLLNDGLKSFEAKEYDKAVSKFSLLLKKSEKEVRFNDIALFYRAESYHELDQKDKAVSDLLTLITKYKSSKYLAASRKLYKAWGGDMGKLLPAESPKQVWGRFIKAVQKGDKKAAAALSTGTWLEQLSRQSVAEIQKNINREEITIRSETIGTGDNAGTATLVLAVSKDLISMLFELDKETNSWLIAGPDIKKLQERGGSGAGERRRVIISNINNLKQLGLACRMYSNVYNENFPPTLNALKTEGFLVGADRVFLWTNIKTGKKLPFIYAPGYNESDSVETMLAAAPMPVNGKREVLWIDGHVKSISEEQFIKNAKAQRWRLKGLVKKGEVPVDQQKLAKELIAKLADDDFDVRKKAKAELIKMGDNAYPFLEENINNPDPEVKMTIKEIMEGR